MAIAVRRGVVDENRNIELANLIVDKIFEDLQGKKTILKQLTKPGDA